MQHTNSGDVLVLQSIWTKEIQKRQKIHTDAGYNVEKCSTGLGMVVAESTCALLAVITKPVSFISSSRLKAMTWRFISLLLGNKRLPLM